jgi:hypothetical protein
VLTGSARVAQEEEDRRKERRLQQERQERTMTAKATLRSLETRIAALQLKKEVHEKEIARMLGQGEEREKALLAERAAMRRSRGLLAAKPHESNGRGETV